MPSHAHKPSLQELMLTASGMVRTRLPAADFNEGSWREHLTGVGALLWREQIDRVETEFASLYRTGARDERLDSYIEARYSIERVENDPGGGAAVLYRTSAAAGGGTIWAGTRIRAYRTGAERIWTVQANVPVGATQLVVHVPIKADASDGGGAIFEGEFSIFEIIDPLWVDASATPFIVTELSSNAGTFRQKDEEYLDTVETTVRDERPGYAKAIEAAMKDVGAAVVYLFQSDWLGTALDAGLNYILVGDGSYETPNDLLHQCRLAVSTACIAGMGVQVLPIHQVGLEFDILLTPWTTSSSFDLEWMRAAASAAVVEYFNRDQNALIWSESAIEGAIRRAVRGVLRDVQLNPSIAAPVLADLFSSTPVSRYSVNASNVRIQVAS